MKAASWSAPIPRDVIDRQNKLNRATLERRYAALGADLAQAGFDIEQLVEKVSAFGVAIPSWGVGTGGTRFGRFPGAGEPRNVFEKLMDCAVVQQIGRATPRISLHIPWDKPDDPQELKQAAAAAGLEFDAMNSNTFQDQPGCELSYKFGSLSHTDKAVRAMAVEHNAECIEIGETLGSSGLTVWIGDGSNFPGQSNFRAAFERYLESLRQIYARLPARWLMYIEHKLYEPAFYSTVLQDWGSSYIAASALGAQAKCIVDLGHHAPNVNVEMIVSRLFQFGKLGGFHFNDSQYGDDDLDAGSINPFRLFLVMNEVVDAVERCAAPTPAFMLDQSHNITDPIESLLRSAEEARRAYAQALLVDRNALEALQTGNDALAASEALKVAFRTDVEPILQMARLHAGGAIDLIGTYRASGYRARMAGERPQTRMASAGIV